MSSAIWRSGLLEKEKIRSLGSGIWPEALQSNSFKADLDYKGSDFSAGGYYIGGGLLGLEAANALAQLGLETHVVEMAPRLMAVQVDDAGGATAQSATRGTAAAPPKMRLRL